MKNILVSTDFSQNAKTAACLAAELARCTGARLIVFHAFNPIFAELQSDAEDPEEAEDTSIPDLEKEAQGKLDALAYELHLHYGISITRLLKPGFAPEEISAMASRTNAELVVLGARGTNVQVHKLIGGVALEALTKGTLPLVCIPSDVSAHALPYVVLMLNERQNLSTPSGLTKLNELALGSPWLKIAKD